MLVMTTISCSTNSTNELSSWSQRHRPPTELVDMTLDVPKIIEQNQTVNFRITVTNKSKEKLLLNSLSDPYMTTPTDSTNQGVYDFMITDQQNRLYWSKFHEAAIPDLGVGISIDSGESFVLEREWNGKGRNNQVLKPGTYEVIGVYVIDSIVDLDKQNTIIENPKGYYTTEPQEIIIK
ncbi:MAG: hypothetical protein EX285_09260 [Thaumarchaeota archaeon]|nr:hypothetical protein [Nitrososphaerota archaeon]